MYTLASEYYDSNLSHSEASTSSRVPSPRLARAGYWASYKLINCSESQLGQLGHNQQQLGHNQQQLGHNQHQLGHNQLGHTELGTAIRSSQLGHRRSQQLGHRSSGSSSGSSTAARSQLELASCERQFSTLDTTRRLYY